MPIDIFIFRLVCALLAGIIIGTQRELRQHQAGLTTNALVAVGACIFILISESVIMKNGVTIHGLSSAATIWCSAAVGCLCGYGFWVEALIAVATIIFINWGLKGVEIYFKRKKKDDNDTI